MSRSCLGAFSPPQYSQRDAIQHTTNPLVMAIQFERRPLEPTRPPRKGDHEIHKFWAPKANPQQVKAKTPQPQRKMVSFWETKSSKQNNLVTTSSKSMVSLVQHEVEETRGYTPSDVAKDPIKREFLTNLSKKIFSPSDGANKRVSRNSQTSRSFRVRRKILVPFPNPTVLLHNTHNRD